MTSLLVTGLLIQAVPGIVGCRGAAGEATGVRGAGGVQHGLAFVLDRGRGADMHRVRGMQPYPRNAGARGCNR